MYKKHAEEYPTEIVLGCSVLSNKV